MADIVDELGISIKVDDNNSAKKINDITNAVENLQQKIQTSNISKINRQGIAPKLGKIDFQKQIENSTMNLSGKSAEESAKFFQSILEPTRTKFKQLNKDIKQTSTTIKDASKETDKATNSNSKFLQSLKRIAMYRLIRSVLKEIGNAAKQGLGNLRTENAELDKSLSNLSASATSLKNSFASMLSPIIQSMQPAITAISDGLANYINKVNEAKAATQGQDKYTRILTSDTEEYKKQLNKVNGALLDFDTFTKLSTKDSYTGVKEEDVKISKEDAQDIVDNSNIIQNAIKGLVVTIAGLKLLSWVAGLNVAFTALSVPILAIVAGVASIYLGFKSLFNNENLSMTEKIATAFFAIAAGILAAVIAIKLLHFDYAGAIGAGLIVAGGVAGLISLKNSTKQFANGGSYNTGDYFVANENGNTELVASTNHGGAVMNTEQLQEAIYNGMSMALVNSGSKEITLKVDQNTLGRVVANSPSFTSEINRRNSALHLI